MQTILGFFGAPFTARISRPSAGKKLKHFLGGNLAVFSKNQGPFLVFEKMTMLLIGFNVVGRLKR